MAVHKSDVFSQFIPASTAESGWNLHLRVDAYILLPANDVNSAFQQARRRCETAEWKKPDERLAVAQYVLCAPRGQNAYILRLSPCIRGR